MSQKQKTRKPKVAIGKASKPRVAEGYEVVGTTSDGVKVLRSKVKPVHFTAAEIREAISDVQKRGSDRAEIGRIEAELLLEQARRAGRLRRN